MMRINTTILIFVDMKLPADFLFFKTVPRIKLAKRNFTLGKKLVECDFTPRVISSVG